MRQEEDSLLVRQCLDGNQKAFEELVDRYQKPVFNLAFRFTTDTEDAEDITQTVFVKAFEKLSTFDPKYKFFSWLYKIAVNESINFLNRKRDFDRFDETLHSKQREEETAGDPEMTLAINNALLELKPDYRILVILNHFQDLSYREIAYILDLRENTVKSRLFSARRVLRRVLMKKGIANA
ncbi:MAG: sigma-70 family RNA polymerase sigma factor [Ignavibacterium sp.]|jgi:RNA polymerase sigma-70 factor (ECF subfamily)